MLGISKKRKLSVKEQKEKLKRDKFWDNLLSGLDEELKEVIIHGYNFSDFRAKEKDYLMTIEYQGKKFSETFRTETKGYFIFTDLEDKFRAVKKIVEQIITDFKLSRVENSIAQ